MALTPTRQGPSRYELRVAGHLDDHWSAWFGDLTLTRDSDGTTSLCGLVSDQAELHGLLMKVRDLSMTLISVAVIDERSTSKAKHVKRETPRNRRRGGRARGPDRPFVPGEG